MPSISDDSVTSTERDWPSQTPAGRSRPVRVVLDACVLFPPTLRDTLLDTAAAGLYRPHWSSAILEELRRSLIADGRLDDFRAVRLITAIDDEFPDASVKGFDARIAEMTTNDPDDRHVLAAAVVGQVRAIVTSNLRDFPPAALKPFRMQAWSPDGLLVRLLRADADAVRRVLEEQASAYRKPPRSLEDVLQRLAKHAPIFVERFPSVTARTSGDGEKKRPASPLL